MKNENKPITPIYGATNVLMTDNSQDESWLKASGALTGLTKLEYTAIEAMKGLLSNPELLKQFQEVKPENMDKYIAINAIESAKALLTELQNTEK